MNAFRKTAFLCGLTVALLGFFPYRGRSPASGFTCATLGIPTARHRRHIRRRLPKNDLAPLVMDYARSGHSVLDDEVLQSSRSRCIPNIANIVSLPTEGSNSRTANSTLVCHTGTLTRLVSHSRGRRSR
jgi:hypothetical protein